MLKIKTIIKPASDTDKFDEEVNKALAEGWELVKRDILLLPCNEIQYTGAVIQYNQYRSLYAELEMYTDEPEEDEPEEDDGLGEWVVTRNPSAPYRCNKCGHLTPTPAPRCPVCGRTMASYR